MTTTANPDRPASPEQTDEKGRPMTYWGGKSSPASAVEEVKALLRQIETGEVPPLKESVYAASEFHKVGDKALDLAGRLDEALTLQRQLQESNFALIDRSRQAERRIAELEKALHAARGTLIQVSPCMAEECKQDQEDFINWALKEVDAALAQAPVPARIGEGWKMVPMEKLISYGLALDLLATMLTKSINPAAAERALVMKREIATMLAASPEAKGGK